MSSQSKYGMFSCQYSMNSPLGGEECSSYCAAATLHKEWAWTPSGLSLSRFHCTTCGSAVWVNFHTKMSKDPDSLAGSKLMSAFLAERKEASWECALALSIRITGSFLFDKTFLDSQQFYFGHPSK